MYDCSFKKEVSLNKYKNTKHETKKANLIWNLGEGEFGFVLDVRQGNNKDAKATRQVWRKEMKYSEQSRKNYSSRLSDIEIDHSQTKLRY